LSTATSSNSSQHHIMGVYNRAPLAFERGRGARLFSTTGDEYLDCVAGIATCGLGHAHPVLVEALKTQGEKLWHVSNIYTIPEQEVLADKLCAATFADVVFFTNSGTEAIECALKAARRYHVMNGQSERVDIIGFDGSFHGRSYAAVNASGNAGYLDGFGPRLPGFVQLPFGDFDALKAALGETTAAVIIEPVQGEGGARALTEAQLHGAAPDDPRRRRPADLRRGPERHGPDRQALRLRVGASTQRAGHHVRGQGPGRRLPGRRVPGLERGGAGHDPGYSRLDLRRQPAGYGRRSGGL
jgi:acetylornithine/succinyldiaminopimelate/putrescine aminotransferase